ncbi:dual specificity phosphatase 1 [Ictidomys tridecemlineatus]|uniref:dual specificity protein phosphatase 1 n=1 Tax=Ictidomys tridecemlineatus TaxID=43179 RepID=UPI00038C5424|nr:dual specificity protein phosphatase 1 [Ictidomys tridecemlineatus]KAG3265258.1 dual specificity phosphatase 1 [Ictidomys tridecemlineatus]
MVMEVGTLDAGGLRALLRERAAQCLLLDCRSFFAFNAGHIAGSVNVRFSTIVRRRAKGAMGLEHIVPNAELRGRLLAGSYHAVVLLDERSVAVDGAKRDSTLALTALINVSANCPNHFEGHYQYKSIPVEDNHKADISSWFNEAIDFIDSIKNAGGRVFVHCQAGISRSATICLAYLMRTNRVKLDEAFEFVKQRRSIISPNFSFMGQLLQFESQVLAPHCSAEAGSPAMAVLDRGTSTTTVFNFPVSIPVHSTNSALSYLQSPITTSPSC